MSSSTEKQRNGPSSSKDPVTAVLIVLVAATALVPHTIAAPMPNSIDQDSWWFNACGHGDEHRPVRHSQHENCTGNKVPPQTKVLIKRAMNISMSYFQKYKIETNNIYGEVMQGFNTYTHHSYPFLPKFKKPAHPDKKILTKYHRDLQVFIVALHTLNTLKIETDVAKPWQEKRRENLKNHLHTMRNLLCDIETAVNMTCQTIPERISTSYAREQGLNPKTESVTDLYLADWGVLKRLEVFMKRSKKLPQLLPPLHKKGNKRLQNKKQTLQKQKFNKKATTKPPKRQNRKKKPPT